MRDLRWRDFDDALVLRAVYPPELASLSKLYVMSKKGKKKRIVRIIFDSIVNIFLIVSRFTKPGWKRLLCKDI